MDRGGAFQRLDRNGVTVDYSNDADDYYPDSGWRWRNGSVGAGAWVPVSTIGDFVGSSLMVAQETRDQETRDNVAREARNTTQPYLNLGPAGIFIIG